MECSRSRRLRTLVDPNSYFQKFPRFCAAIPFLFTTILLSVVLSLFNLGASPHLQASDNTTIHSFEGVTFSAVERARLLQHSSAVLTRPDPSNHVSLDPRAIKFGQLLFFDARLSSNGRVTCATCHDPSRSWCDNKDFGKGVADTRRNVPSLYNVAAQRWFFWDGRADSLWAQALGPLENAAEHDSDRVAIVRLLSRDPSLRSQYEELFEKLPTAQELAAFPEHATPLRDRNHEYSSNWSSMGEAAQERVNVAFANVGKSIAAFVGTIRSGEAPFDSFAAGLRANDQAKISTISASAQRGAKLFVGKAGCRNCHSGHHLSDGEFHSIGLAARDADEYVDPGRLYGISHVKADPFNRKGVYSDLVNPGTVSVDQLVIDGSKWGQFKTPSLRNVGKTAPYMHNSNFRTLREVVDYYSTLKGAAVLDHHEEQVLVPLRLQEQEIDDLVSFLECLTEVTRDDGSEAVKP